MEAAAEAAASAAPMDILPPESVVVPPAGAAVAPGEGGGVHQLATGAVAAGVADGSIDEQAAVVASLLSLGSVPAGGQDGAAAMLASNAPPSSAMDVVVEGNTGAGVPVALAWSDVTNCLVSLCVLQRLRS